MSAKISANDGFGGLPPAMPFLHLLLILLGIVAGAFAAVVVAPVWLPGLVTSLLGPRPTAYWYLSRASALVAYGLLWLSMALGLAISNRMARTWPGGSAAFDLHQHASLLGLAFALFHGLILTGDRYIDFTLGQVVMPFASAGYRPFWVGLGQTAFYLLALVGFSFYAVRVIGRRLWRAIHFLSFAVYALALIHGVMSGSDSASLWVSRMYWFSGGSLLFLAVYRLLARAVEAPGWGRAGRHRSSQCSPGHAPRARAYHAPEGPGREAAA